MIMRRYLPETLICLLIVITICLVYYQINDFSYILYDDILAVDNPYMVNGITPEKITRAFGVHDHVPYMSPVPLIIAMAQWEFAGDDYGMHHLFSLFLHASTAIMLFLFLRSATGKKWESGLCAALFALHPINVEPVVWLTGVSGLLEAFFLIFTLLFYHHYIVKPSLKRYFLIFPTFILGLLCKPSIAVLPLLMICLDYWPFHRIGPTQPIDRNTVLRADWFRLILEKIPFIFIVILQFLFRELLINKRSSFSKNTPIHFHPGGIIDFVLYMKKIVYPAELTICYPQPPVASLGTAFGVLGILALITCLLLRATRFKKFPGYIITGWIWFLAACLPVLIMVSFSDRPVADRHLYIPLIGIFIIISFGMGNLIRSVPYGRPIFLSMITLFLTMLAIISYTQTTHWMDSITIFSHAVSLDPDNKRALSNLGDAFLENGEINKATQYYQELVRVDPQSALAHTKLAKALALQKNAEKAAAHYKKALILSPEYEFAQHNYADLLMENGHIDEAIQHYRKALAINPNLFRTHNNLATAFLKKGNVSMAVFHLKQALKINPDYKTARVNLRIITQKTPPSPATP